MTITKLRYSGTDGSSAYKSKVNTNTKSDYAEQLALAEKYNNIDRAWSAEQAQKQMDFQAAMSSTAHQREVADLKAAGLNPVLSAGGSGASTPAGAAGESSSLSAIIPDLIQSMNAKEELSYQKERDRLEAERDRLKLENEQRERDRQYQLQEEKLRIEQEKWDYQKQQDAEAAKSAEQLAKIIGSGTGKGSGGSGSGKGNWSSGQSYSGKYFYVGMIQDLIEGATGKDMETFLHETGAEGAKFVASLIDFVKKRSDGEPVDAALINNSSKILSEAQKPNEWTTKFRKAEDFINNLVGFLKEKVNPSFDPKSYNNGHTHTGGNF